MFFFTVLNGGMLGADIPDPLVSDPFCCGRCLTQAM
jgi:hypothetical protein